MLILIAESSINQQSPITNPSIRNQQYAVRNSGFFVIFFERRERAGWLAEGFAMIEERQIPHVERHRTGRRLRFDDDRDRTAFDAVAEADRASAGETRVPESLQHPEGDSTTGAT
jgi:hypothetical protein